MEPSQFGVLGKENFYLLIGIQAVMGFVLGLIPLVLSFRKKKQSLGYVALGVSLVLSLISPILSLIAIIVFCILIVRKPATE